jgi:hypothetical protein
LIKIFFFLFILILPENYGSQPLVHPHQVMPYNLPQNQQQQQFGNQSYTLQPSTPPSYGHHMRTNIK